MVVLHTNQLYHSLIYKKRDCFHSRVPWADLCTFLVPQVEKCQLIFLSLMPNPCKNIHRQVRVFACSRTLAIIKIMHIAYAIFMHNHTYSCTLNDSGGVRTIAYVSVQWCAYVSESALLCGNLFDACDL